MGLGSQHSQDYERYLCVRTDNGNLELDNDEEILQKQEYEYERNWKVNKNEIFGQKFTFGKFLFCCMKIPMHSKRYIYTKKPVKG